MLPANVTWTTTPVTAGAFVPHAPASASSDATARTRNAARRVRVRRGTINFSINTTPAPLVSIVGGTAEQPREQRLPLRGRQGRRSVPRHPTGRDLHVHPFEPRA